MTLLLLIASANRFESAGEAHRGVTMTVLKSAARRRREVHDFNLDLYKQQSAHKERGERVKTLAVLIQDWMLQSDQPDRPITLLSYETNLRSGDSSITFTFDGHKFEIREVRTEE